uniref:Uncharacterized protein n=1 Tax=Peronospora matthiolae TaxID=2874970 RepID=A0AAV1UH46_9STRA
MLGMWTALLLLAALVGPALGQSNATQSGCEVCASTGDCSQAYRDTAGQFCGHWLDRQNARRPCCCPDNSVCRVSNYACNCNDAGNAYPYRARHGGENLLWLWTLLGSLALLLCCCGSCFMMAKRMKDQRNAIPFAAPVASPVTENLSSQPCETTSAAYAGTPYEPVRTATSRMNSSYYGQGRSGGGMGAGTGAALGGTAGLIGGLMLGGALADHGDSYGYGGSFDGGGGFDNGGGFDGGGGDFGGDF